MIHVWLIYVVSAGKRQFGNISSLLFPNIFIFIHRKASSTKEQTSSIKNKLTNNQSAPSANPVGLIR